MQCDIIVVEIRLKNPCPFASKFILSDPRAATSNFDWFNGAQYLVETCARIDVARPSLTNTEQALFMLA
jgi:hypothetical protein